MKTEHRRTIIATTLALVLSLSGLTVLAQDKPEAGGPSGAGMGALLGQASRGSTASTVVGAGVGAGVGYLIGNEADKKEAHTRQMAIEQDVRPLANTSWQVVSVTPKPAEPIRSVVGRFNADGTVTTTTAYWDGRTVTDTNNERYRIVGQTLIINQDDWVINATFRLDGDSLYIDTGRYILVMERLLTVASRDRER